MRSDRASCIVYDIRGNKILESLLSGGDMNTIDLPSGAKGVFIVTIKDGAKVTTRKVVVL